MTDDDMANPATGPGPVHVYQERAGPRGWAFTACGLEADGLLCNGVDGPTSCPECQASIVEAALAQCEHHNQTDDGNGYWVCDDCGIWMGP